MGKDLLKLLFYIFQWQNSDHFILSINVEMLELYFLTECTEIPKFWEWSMIIFMFQKFFSWRGLSITRMKQARLKIKSTVSDMILPQVFRYMFKFFHSNYLGHVSLLSQFYQNWERFKIFQNITEQCYSEKEMLMFQMSQLH